MIIIILYYSVQSEKKEESTDKEEYVHLHVTTRWWWRREGKGIKILTPKKLLTRFPILLAQIKAGNNSYKLKNEIRQILYLLYQHNKITKKVYNNLIKSLQCKKICLW